MSLDALAADIDARAEGRARYLVGDRRCAGVGQVDAAPRRCWPRSRRCAPGRAALVPMDGYHFDDAVLVERGFRPRKGAPQTFDVDGLERDLERIRAGGRDVVVPVFDRSLELARAAARLIRP